MGLFDEDMGDRQQSRVSASISSAGTTTARGVTAEGCLCLLSPQFSSSAQWMQLSWLLVGKLFSVPHPLLRRVLVWIGFLK